MHLDGTTDNLLGERVSFPSPFKTLALLKYICILVDTLYAALKEPRFRHRLLERAI